MSPLEQRFGRVIREVRAGRGWSQERLAEAADLNRSYLGEIERGQVVASLVTADKLAAALRIPLSSLLGRCETAAPYSASGATPDALADGDSL